MSELLTNEATIPLHACHPRGESAESERLMLSEKRFEDYKHWGPYVSERAWATVREDYSPNGDAWSYFPHDHARSRAYRWNEDGIAGFCNRFQNICLTLALWNEKDPILKERLFGVTGTEGNHGEDCKELYYYLDGTPTHSYMKMLYKYPQDEYPYADLVAENSRRSRMDPEYEITDALRDCFQQNRYFDVFVEYAKAGAEDILCKITAVNRGTDPAPLHIVPHVFFRNTWAWGYRDSGDVCRVPDRIDALGDSAAYMVHRHLKERWWHAAPATVNGAEVAQPELLFTNNDTNYQRLYGSPNSFPFVKDGFHEYIVNGKVGAVNPAKFGSKACAHYYAVVGAGESMVVQIRFTNKANAHPFSDFNDVMNIRKREADEFYATVHDPSMNADQMLVQRQAFAGLLWSKQFYHFHVRQWAEGDPSFPAPPPGRELIRNGGWYHMHCLDVLSMPDKWEYPWFASWDLAFHTLSIAMIDPEWAKRQIILLTREWYLHPNGQLPAYEWNFNDVNPPVHAWAALRVYQISKSVTGIADLSFLARAFHKLLLNFTWWVNRKDAEGRNVFQGGFLGLDNIGVFDRSAPLPAGMRLDQVDGTAWMAKYCLNMLAVALELAVNDITYEDVATKFFEHFIYIANALNNSGLWDEQEGFYFDMLRRGSCSQPLRIFSCVGLTPLFAVETVDQSTLDRLPNFTRRLQWFLKYRPFLTRYIAQLTPNSHGRYLLSVVPCDRMKRLLARVFDEQQFFSPHGLRSISSELEHTPFTLHINDELSTVRYEPAESRSNLFGGNSNWRGPVWMPINYLMVEALQKYDLYYDHDIRIPVKCHGRCFNVTLKQAALELARRLTSIFTRNSEGTRPVYGGDSLFCDVHFRDHVLFYEYFHGNSGAGLGASHQTGWTALVANLLQKISGLGAGDMHSFAF